MKLFLLAVLMFVLGSVACARAAIIYISITPQELVDLLGEYGVKGHIEENCVVVVSIEIDLNTTGGVTKESLFAFFRIIDLSLEKYHELLFPSASR